MSLNLEQASGLNAVFAVASAGAALTGLSGAATTYSTSAFGYAISGALYSKAAVAGGATPTTDGNTSAAMTLVASQASAFVWAINAAGTITVFQGPVIKGLVVGQTYQLPLPSLPAGYVAFAYHTAVAGSTTSGTWTYGSSNWNATGLTISTPINVAQMPNAGVTITA